MVDPAALRRGRQTLDLEFTIMVRREFRRGQDGPVQGLDVAGVATHEGTKLMELSGAFGWMSAANWTALRAGAGWDPGPQITPAHPDRVGRSCRENVVIGEPAPHADGACAPVVVDIAHPTIFDHPLDHLPGGLIIEAGRQLAMTLLGGRAAAVTGPARMRCDFQSFESMTHVLAGAAGGWRPTWDTALKALALIAAGAFLRMVDDQKDLDYDRRYNPSRPLVQGRISTRELQVAMAPAAMVALLLAAAVSSTTPVTRRPG